MAVVNGRAEQGVALIQDFKKKLTRDKDQLQCLLQVASEQSTTVSGQNKKNSVVASTY